MQTAFFPSGFLRVNSVDQFVIGLSGIIIIDNPRDHSGFS